MSEPTVLTTCVACNTGQHQMCLGGGCTCMHSSEGRCPHCATSAQAQARVQEENERLLEEIRRSDEAYDERTAQLREAGRLDVPLERYGVWWVGPKKPICHPMPDGYWTPWHLASQRVKALEAQRDDLATALRGLRHEVDNRRFYLAARLKGGVGPVSVNRGYLVKVIKTLDRALAALVTLEATK